MGHTVKCAGIVVSGAMALLTAHAQSLPAGSGKAEFQRICSACHSADRATSQRMTRPEWAAVVSDMVGRGAQGSSAELDSVVNYLSANFGKGNAPSPAAPSHTAPAATETAPKEAVLSSQEVAAAKRLVRQNGCLSCHRVGDEGSYVGPSLEEAGAHHTPQQLRASLVSPNKNVVPENRTVRLVTSTGQTVTGRLLNQDGFSVQLIDAAGQLRSLDRLALREFVIVTANPMPSYAGKVREQDLTILVDYLSSLKGGTQQ
jgi:putative heme-binding domain-containing protein